MKKETSSFRCSISGTPLNFDQSDFINVQLIIKRVYYTYFIVFFPSFLLAYNSVAILHPLEIVGWFEKFSKVFDLTGQLDKRV